jgi:hypothetical protein
VREFAQRGFHQSDEGGSTVPIVASKQNYEAPVKSCLLQVSHAVDSSRSGIESKLKL